MTSQVFASPPALSVVVPTYGRGDVLATNLERLLQTLTGSENSRYRPVQLIVVDDASPDDSFNTLRELARRYSCVTGIRLADNVGQQNATLAGIRQASGTAVVTFDDDLKNDPRDIFQLLDALEKGFDVVYGIPQTRPRPGLRRWGSWLKETVFQLLLKKPRDIQLTAFRAMNRQTADRLAQETRRRVYLSATLLQEAVRIGQLQVCEQAHQEAQSGYSLGRLAGVIKDLVLEYAPVAKRFRKTGPQYTIKEVVP